MPTAVVAPPSPITALGTTGAGEPGHKRRGTEAFETVRRTAPEG